LLGAAACSPAPRSNAPLADNGVHENVEHGANASAVFFNHAFAVVDAETAKAIASSEDVRAFGATESRTTASASDSWSGFYVYGRETFIEIFAPSPDYPEGKTGLGLQVERIGALDEMVKTLAAAKYALQADERSMKLPDGSLIPWFRFATPATWPDAMPVDVWVAENHPSFMAHRLAPRAVEPNDISRRTYLSNKFATSQLLENVTGVTIRETEADRDRIAAAMTAFGWRLRREGETVIAESGDTTITIAASREPPALMELRMVLTRETAPRDVRLGHSTLTLGPGRAARWTFDVHSQSASSGTHT
jgi:hypothetical protein